MEYAALIEQLDRVGYDHDGFYESDEPLVSASEIARLRELCSSAASNGGLLAGGHISPYFGELSAAWHHGERMVQVAVFPSPRLSVIVWGSTPKVFTGKLGQYQSEYEVSGSSLASKLEWMRAAE